MIGSRAQQAVSPIIGVMLLLGVVAVLVSISGVILFDIGEQNTESQEPGVSFQYERPNSTSVSITVEQGGTCDAVTVSTTGGNERQIACEFGNQVLIGNNTNPVRSGETVLVSSKDDSIVVDTYELRGNTKDILTVVTGGFSISNDTNATVNGRIDIFGDSETSEAFIRFREEGTSTFTTTRRTTESSETRFSRELTGLQRNTSFEYQAVANGDNGNSDRGEIRVFRTTGELFAETKPATNIESTTATLEGNVTDVGISDTAEVFFQFREKGTTTFTNTTNQTVSSFGRVNQSITGLSQDTRFQFRVVANSTDGFDTGEILEFATLPSPRVETVESNQIGAGDANLVGNLTETDSNTDVFFQFRQQGATQFTNTTPQVVSSPQEYSDTVLGLSERTTFEFRAAANSTLGTSDRGNIQVFTTEENRIYLTFVDNSGTVNHFSKNEDDPISLGVSGKIVGPQRVDIAGGPATEVPFVNSTNTLSTINESGTQTVLADSALKQKTTFFSGTFAPVTSDNSVFYINTSDNNFIHIVNGSSKSVPIFDGIKAGAIGDKGDVDGDGVDELTIAGTSQTLKYIEPDGTVEPTGINLGSNNGIGFGPSHDFDGDGFDEVTMVDGGNVVELANATTGSTTTIASGAFKGSLSVIDFNNDGQKEILFVDNSDSQIRIIEDVLGTNSVSKITDSSGSGVTATADGIR